MALATTAMPQKTFADGADFAAGILTGIVGSAIVNNAQKPKYVVRKQAAPRPTVNTYERQQNREVQTSLNYFGFPAGVPDGIMGRNSRSAVAQYQAFMGYPATGALTEYERAFLTSSYQRAIIGGPQVSQVIAARGLGPRGLLHAYRDEQMGGSAMPQVQEAAAPPPPAVAPQTEPVAAATPAPAVVPVPVPAAPVVEAAAGSKLPSFLAQSTGVSIASHCNRVSMSTGSNGGFITAASMTDPQQALNEQFCLARTYAIEQGDSLAVTVQGFSMAEMQQQCEAFAPTMFEYQARIASQSPAEAAASLQDFVVATGAPPAQLSANARICLGIGYRTDNAELALASAMVLVGLGEDAYGEMLGHHLLNGFAAPKRTDRGMEWLEVAILSLESGSSPLVSTGGAGRTQLLKAAVQSATGVSAGPVLQDASAPVSGGFVLPGATAAAN